MRPAKTQISLGIHPVWSVFTVLSMGSLGTKLSSCGQRTLGCPGWSESLLGAHATLLVLSWWGSYDLRFAETMKDHSHNQRRLCRWLPGTTFQNRQLHVLFLLTIKHILAMWQVGGRYQRLSEPEDHWSCITHLSVEDMLKSADIEEKKFKNIISEWLVPRSMNDLDLWYS